MGVAGDSLLFEGWQGVDATKLLLALLPVWILGAFIGMLVRFSALLEFLLLCALSGRHMYTYCDLHDCRERSYLGQDGWRLARDLALIGFPVPQACFCAALP